MSTNNEKAGGFFNDDSEMLNLDRPDLEESLTLSDKSKEESTGDVLEHGEDIRTELETEISMITEEELISTSSNEACYVNSTITNREIVEKVKSQRTPKAKLDRLYQLISESLSCNLNEFATQELLLDCRRWLNKFKTRLAKVQRTYSRLQPDWLALHFRISKSVLEVNSVEQSTTASAPTPIADNTSAVLESLRGTSAPKKSSTATVYRKMHTIAKTLDPFSPKKIVSIAAKATKKKGMAEVSRLLRLSKQSPGRPAKMLQAYRRYASSVQSTKYSNTEALGLMIDLNLTKDQYMKIRKGAKSHGCDIYPAYNNVRSEKQRCRPPRDHLVVSETKAFVPMQSLLDHTSNRLIEMQSTVVSEIYQHYNLTESNATLLCSFGFDGSTGQSNYKQRFHESQDAKFDDSSLFATTIIPLRLVMDNGAIVWQNRTPQSPRFCRPLKLEFVKESKDLIQSQKVALDFEIANLFKNRIQVRSDELKQHISIKYDMKMTVIDGKVLSAVLGVSSAQVCPLCKAKPSTFNNLCDIETRFKPEPDRLHYGISPLHAWIRSLEFCLHLSYRLEFKQWQARGPVLQEMVAKRKRHVQQQLIERMGLRVDFPRTGGSGTSNDGNTARRAFQQSELFSEIIGIELRLVKDLGTILIALNSQFQINKDKFKSFCIDLALWYVSKYQWFPMPVSVHKILIHGSDIIGESLLPVGMYGEEAGESKNKFYKQDRLHHSRKFSRLATMTDMFNRSMDTSDPILSTISLADRENSRIRKALPFDVIQLLEPSSTHTSAPSALADKFNDSGDSEEEVISIPLLDGILLDSEELALDDDVSSF